MSFVPIRVRPNIVVRVERQHRGGARELFDTRAALEAAGRAIRSALVQHFSLEYGANDDGVLVRWPELAESTKYTRQRLGYPPDGPMLVRTGKYRAEILGDADPDVELDPAFERAGIRITPGGSVTYTPAITNRGKFHGLSDKRPALGLTTREKAEVRRRIVEAGLRGAR